MREASDNITCEVRPVDPCGLGILSTLDCERVLAEEHAGRLALVVGGRSHLVEVEYRYEQGGDGIAMGDLPTAGVDGAVAALEVDGASHGRPEWAIIVHGRAESVAHREVPRSLRRSRLPLARRSPTAAVRILPDAINGRVVT